MPKEPAVLLIGAGPLQVPQIMWARELGLQVIVTDARPRPAGSRYADRIIRVNGCDGSALNEIAFQIRSEYDLVGVYAGSDFALQSVAEISRRHRLPGHAPEAVDLCLDKTVQKKMLQQNNLPVPPGTVVRGSEAGLDAAGALGYPLIVKPASASGSRGVVTVTNDAQLLAAIRNAQVFSTTVLLEKCITGRHIDANGLIIDGRLIRCGLFERYFSPPPLHLPLWGYQEPGLTLDEKERIYSAVSAAAHCLGLKNGPVKADCILSQGTPYLLEIGPRFHGDIGTSFTTPAARGTQPIKAWFAYLKGDQDFTQYLQPTRKHYAGWKALFPQQQGEIQRISGMQEARAMPSILKIILKLNAGRFIRPHRDNTTLCGFVVGCSQTKQELKDALLGASDRILFKCA